MSGITIAQLTAKGSEHGEQVALFAWAAIARVHGFAVAWEWAKVGQAAYLGLATPSVKFAVPELEWLHAIPNGGSRGDDEKTRAIRGGTMKAEGARSGVPDVFLPVPVFNSFEHIQWCGLYIEMKKPTLKPKSAASKGGLSDDQLKFKEYALRMGYGWIVCYTWHDAATAIQSYLEWKG